MSIDNRAIKSAALGFKGRGWSGINDSGNQGAIGGIKGDGGSGINGGDVNSDDVNGVDVRGSEVNGGGVENPSM